VLQNDKIDLAKVIKTSVEELTGTKVNKHTRIFLPHLTYFQELVHILDNTEMETIVNFVSYRCIH